MNRKSVLKHKAVHNLVNGLFYYIILQIIIALALFEHQDLLNVFYQDKYRTLQMAVLSSMPGMVRNNYYQ